MSTNYVAQVREFMEAFQQAVPLYPAMPGGDTLYARHQMLVEESLEIAEACSRVQLLDGIADALYVTYGTAVAAGFTDDQIAAAFAEVHRSNMTKLWPDHLVQTRPPNTKATQTHGGWIVKRGDGKVIKPPTYLPPRLGSICGAA